MKKYDWIELKNIFGVRREGVAQPLARLNFGKTS